MSITINDTTTKLLEELYEIEKQCFKQEAFSKQQIAYLLTDYNAISLIACVDDDLAGFAIARIDIKRTNSYCHILTVDVKPSHRRKGVAQKLLHEIESILKAKGIREIRLEVREDNTAASNLYQKLGYRQVGKLEKYYGDAHGLYLKKML